MQEDVQISSAAISDRGLSEKRPQNEDSYLELRESGLFAVADGVGGAQAGDVASQMAMEILAEAFLNLHENQDAEVRMREAIERANAAIFQMSNDLPQLSSMATTIVALHIKGNVATIGHVGDSRLYRLAPNGDLYQETLDHSVVEEEVRAGRMTPEQAAVHPSRNVISRALGAEPLVEIDMKTMMVEPNTMFIACSDGVTRHIDDHELRNLLLQAPDTESLCETIKEICYERGAEDNLTAVVVRLESAYAEEYVVAPFEVSGEQLEEETVAGVRAEPAGDSEVLAASSEADTDEFEASTEEMPVSEAREAVDEAEESAAAAGANGKGGDSISMRSAANDSFLSILSEGPGSGESKSSETYREEKKGGGFLSALGKVVGVLVIFALGGAAGVFGYRYWQSTQPKPKPIVQTPVSTPKVALTTFEQTKAEVYKDPSATIATLSANPQNSEDLYFLGLAYILNARYEEAGLALRQAKEKLPEFDEDQRPGLAKEIAFAMTLVDNPAARKGFEQALKEANEEAAKPPASVTPGLPASTN